jgi:hypothetical protein
VTQDAALKLVRDDRLYYKPRQVICIVRDVHFDEKGEAHLRLKDRGGYFWEWRITPQPHPEISWLELSQEVS